MLQFSGNGSAFNVKKGNNSAFYKKGKELILIDCGSNTFQRMLEADILEGVESVKILITHTHTDHVGSLGDFVLYNYFHLGEMYKINVDIYAWQEVKVEELLKINGVLNGVHYRMHKKELGEPFEIRKDLVVSIFETEHMPELKSTGFEIKLEGLPMLYSGDTKNIPKKILEKINTKKYHVAYIDTCKLDYEGNPHIPLNQLEKMIPSDARDIVWCMHLDHTFDRKEAEEMGFHVTENILETGNK